MKKVLVFAMAIMFLASVGVAVAQDKGTPAEAKAMVKKAVAFMKEVGKEKTLAEVNNPKGKFIYKDLYVFVIDMDGVELAHPFTPALIGKNLMNMKDADGKSYVKERAAIAKEKGSGTIDYRWSNPQTKKVEKKQAYFEVVDNMIINCGYYF